MKGKVILTAVFALFLTAVSISAQEKKQTKTVDFSGNWELDAGKSKLGERSRIESVTMKVAQDGKELKVETATKRGFRNESESPRNPIAVNGGANGGGMGRGGFGGGFNGGDSTQTAVYSLEGKETKEEIPGIPGATSVLKAKWEKDGKLLLISTRKAQTPMGERTMTVKETWSLSPDGKVLTVAREQETPRGNFTIEMVFNKK